MLQSRRVVSSSAASHGHQSVGDFIGGLAVGGYAPGEPGRALASSSTLSGEEEWMTREVMVAGSAVEMEPVHGDDARGGTL